LKEINLKTWEDFEKYITKLIKITSKRKKDTPLYISDYLFRGQSDSKWRLETTLERFTGKLLTMEECYKIVYATKAQVETFTGKVWGTLPNLQEYMAEIESEGLLPLGREFITLEYFIYLRHHGFPSPLLDWTLSPYVAAYFAFRDVFSKADSTSIYAYCEYTEGHKFGSSTTPKITGLDPNVRSHRRHFQQQSHYTICTWFNKSKHTYACHQDVFKRENSNQDELLKITIPSVERKKILSRLDQYYNINAYSLIGSEESLMETLSFRKVPFC